MQFGKVTRVADGYADVALPGGTVRCSTALLDVAAARLKHPLQAGHFCCQA